MQCIELFLRHNCKHVFIYIFLPYHGIYILFFYYIGKKILVLDRNPYYGGETASLNLTNLYNTFKPSNKKIT